MRLISGWRNIPDMCRRSGRGLLDVADVAESDLKFSQSREIFFAARASFENCGLLGLVVVGCCWLLACWLCNCLVGLMAYWLSDWLAGWLACCLGRAGRAGLPRLTECWTKTVALSDVRFQVIV